MDFIILCSSITHANIKYNHDLLNKSNIFCTVGYWLENVLCGSCSDYELNVTLVSKSNKNKEWDTEALLSSYEKNLFFCFITRKGLEIHPLKQKESTNIAEFFIALLKLSPTQVRMGSLP